VLQRRGIVMNTMGRISDAEADTRAAMKLFDDLATRFPKVPDYRTAAAVSRNTLVGLMASQGKFEEGAKILERNLELWEGLSAEEPSAVEYRSKLALTNANLAHLLGKSGRKPEAEKALHRAADLRSGITKDYPNTPYHFGALADCVSRLAELAAERGDLAEARRLQEQAISARRAALALAPSNASYQKAASADHAALIETLIRLRDHKSAGKAVAELLALAPESASESFQAASFLASCVPLATADAGLTDRQRDDLAASYSSRAIELLRTSTKRGDHALDDLTNDPGFDALRSRPEFRALLGESTTARR
jgi:tetratricopeptide (TPR) repeat protein